jgi:hypothetical protein
MRHCLFLVIILPAIASASAGSTYRIEKGDTLEKVAIQRYGSRHYAEIIGETNGIKLGNLRAGTVLQVPELQLLLENAGLYAQVKEEMEAILQARALFTKQSVKLKQLHSKTANTSVELPDETMKDLLSAVERLESAAKGLGKDRSGFQRPTKTTGQISSALNTMKELAKGANDGYGYDVDNVERHLAYALLNAIRWAKNGFK